MKGIVRTLLSLYWATERPNTNVRISDGNMITDMEKTTYTSYENRRHKRQLYGPTFKVGLRRVKITYCSVDVGIVKETPNSKAKYN